MSGELAAAVATAAVCQCSLMPTWASEAPAMIRPQGGAAVASACRMRSITTGVPRPGTCAHSSPQNRPAKIDGITGCFSMVTTAPPSLPSRPSRELPCWPTSIRNDDRVSMTSEFMLMIISSGTRPGLAEGVGDEGDADADAVGEDRRQAEHRGLAQPHADRAAERHGGEIEQQAGAEEHEQDVERQAPRAAPWTSSGTAAPGTARRR